MWPLGTHGPCALLLPASPSSLPSAATHFCAWELVLNSEQLSGLGRNRMPCVSACTLLNCLCACPSVCVCLSVCVHPCMCVPIHMCVCACSCMPSPIHVLLRVGIHPFMCLSTYVHTPLVSQCICTCVQACTSVSIHVCMCPSVCEHLFVHVTMSPCVCMSMPRH